MASVPRWALRVDDLFSGAANGGTRFADGARGAAGQRAMDGAPGELGDGAGRSDRRACGCRYGGATGSDAAIRAGAERSDDARSIGGPTGGHGAWSGVNSCDAGIKSGPDSGLATRIARICRRKPLVGAIL